MAQIEDNAEDGSYTDLWSRPGFLIRRLHQLHIAIFLEECGDYDVTPVQYAVLSVLYRGKALDQACRHFADRGSDHRHRLIVIAPAIGVLGCETSEGNAVKTLEHSACRTSYHTQGSP